MKNKEYLSALIHVLGGGKDSDPDHWERGIHKVKVGSGSHSVFPEYNRGQVFT